jgi:hypothetical protein
MDEIIEAERAVIEEEMDSCHVSGIRVDRTVGGYVATGWTAMLGEMSAVSTGMSSAIDTLLDTVRDRLEAV